ncbi:hypothetical protein ACLKA7_000180 [Drosophila subpalustris]
MSYQIKRTPYFRRIFNNSRRNGQLQRLREEYERIQEFNDRTIELKMRQVRLKRLFREIEDINESTAPSTSNHHHNQSAVLPMTPEAQQEQQRRLRLEALERARELGQEMSRRNAELAENGNGFYLRSELRATAKMLAADAARREAQERRQRAARRISYGNAQSRSNIKRIAQRRQRQEVIDSLLYASDNNRRSALQLQAQAQAENQPHPDIVKRSMLQQRLQYGNSRSSNNMMRSQMAAAQRVMNCIALPQMEYRNTNNEQLMNRGMQLAMELEYRNTNNNNSNSNNEQLMNRGMQLEYRNTNNSNSNNDNNNNNRVAQLELKYQSLPTSSKNQLANNNNNNNDNNISDDKQISNCNILNAESDLEMQTAMLPPTEDDDMPSTSKRASAMATTTTTTTATTTTTISGFQSPRPSRILRDSTSASERASEHWHRISLTLPWIKVIHDQTIPIPIPIVEPHNNNNDDVVDNNSTTTTAASVASDNYQSFRGPSLMQEDLMQIMELNETNVAPVRRTFGN